MHARRAEHVIISAAEWEARSGPRGNYVKAHCIRMAEQLHAETEDIEKAQVTYFVQYV